MASLSLQVKKIIWCLSFGRTTVLYLIKPLVVVLEQEISTGTLLVLNLFKPKDVQRLACTYLAL